MVGSIQHWSHPQHSLSYVHHGKPYICDGCEIWGQASSYRCCANCDFDLHKSCATAPPVLSNGFHSGQGHCLQLHRSPPRGTPMCAACAQTVKVFGYHCTSIYCGYSLHPSCATLPQNLRDPANRSQILRLQQNLLFPCRVCGQQGLGWAYVATSGHYNFHVACARSMLLDSNHIEVRTQPHDTELKSDGTRDVQISSLRTGPPPPAWLVQQSGGGTRERRIHNLNTSSSSAQSGEIPGPSSYTASPAQQSGRRGIGLGTFWTVCNSLCELTTTAITGDPTSIVGEIGKLFHNATASDN